MDNLQNTSTVDTNVTSKAALVTDLNPSYVTNEQYTHARNAVRSSREGDLGTIGNEPSNSYCFSAPYIVIGSVDLPDGNFLIFSTDNINSEIGVGNPSLCTYTKLYNSDCLNFNLNHIITGVAKQDFQKGTIVTFTDKYNPVRRIELKKLSKTTDCDDILLFKKIQHPCINVTKGQTGNMPNGTYSVAVAYVVNNNIFTDWYSLSNRIQLFSETGANSLNIKVTNLDTEFKEFALVVVGNYVDPITKGVTKVAKIVGNYSTKVRNISISDFINPSYQQIELSQLVLQKQSWQKAGIISSNGNYLLLGDLVSREEENYQLKAMSIKAEYIVEQVLANYYEVDGEDVGYYRDENYDFYIQGIYNTGEFTDKYYISGRKATPFDLAPVSSADVYEYDKQFNDCDKIDTVPRWKVENTAGKMIPENNDFLCDRRILGRGELGYFESTELFPDNKDMFGSSANTPIRYFKMPDEAKVPRYSIIGNRVYINIIGVRFYDIPKFDNPDIVGYRILRSDRKGGNGTVQARGIMTNVRSYQDSLLKQTVLYSNYTVNDLRPDIFLSSTQTVYKNGKETNFTPLTDFHNNKFSFYSPHTLFEPRYSLGSEVKIESEEVADVRGKFEIVHNHPKEKLLNQFSFWISAAVGFIESVLTLTGKQDNTGKSILSAKGVTSGVEFEFDKGFKISSVADLIGLDIVAYITAQVKAGAFDNVLSTIKTILITIGSLGLKIPYSIFAGIKEADDIFNTIYQFTGFTDYVYQYNAVATFNKSIPIKEGNKRRRLLHPAIYVPSTNISVGNDEIFNNLLREKTVYLQLNQPISKPITIDNTRDTITGFSVCDAPTTEVQSTGSVFYATIKSPNPNQYGQLGSAPSVSMHSCPLLFSEDLSETGTLFGGDCIIASFQFQKRMHFFQQNLTNTNYPPGTEYDYRKYRNIAYPRFWMDTTKYDFSELLSGNIINFSRFSRTTSSKHNLDCKKGDKKSISRIDDAYMYLFNNCAMDFLVEVDYNIEFREKGTQPFFSKSDKDLSQIFRSDRLSIPEEFNISRAYSDIYTTEIFAQQQRYDFDPLDRIPTNQSNSVIYSLPSFNLQEVDNWQYFLPANYFAFRESDFGELTAIHKMDQDRLIFLFSKASPYISMGRSLLELNNQTITIGDSGLFAQDPREVMPTDNNYGASTSRYAFSNTHLGRFYPSSNQGRMLSFADSLDDITRQGMAFWCKNYMPIFLYNYFPIYPKIENPVSGVGYLTVFDSYTETLYITKRDFSPKKEMMKDITWNGNNFSYQGLPIQLRDNKYFNDISWTLSYSPAEKSFVSFHDWHPDWVMQMDNHFLSVKGKDVWKHNERFDSFCNFYENDYPFELEWSSSTGQQIHVIRSLEYILEVYKYKNSGRNRFHVLNENFTHLIVKNSEQISPLLNLIKSTQNPEDRVSFPRKNTTNSVSYDILFDKEENKYRINQFWDAVKDRGEFSHAEFHLFPVDESGYKGIINPIAIDLDKPEEQRKKFRHYWNQFRFIKNVSGENKFLCKLTNIKKVISIK